MWEWRPCWVSWDVMTRTKHMGGGGAQISWRWYFVTTSLSTRILKSVYFPECSLVEAGLGPRLEPCLMAGTFWLKGLPGGSLMERAPIFGHIIGSRGLTSRSQSCSSSWPTIVCFRAHWSYLIYLAWGDSEISIPTLSCGGHYEHTIMYTDYWWFLGMGQGKQRKFHGAFCLQNDNKNRELVGRNRK